MLSTESSCPCLGGDSTELGRGENNEENAGDWRQIGNEACVLDAERARDVELLDSLLLEARGRGPAFRKRSQTARGAGIIPHIQLVGRLGC